MSEEEEVEVRVGIIALIHESLEPHSLKANSLLEGHYKEEYKFSDSDLLELLELKLTLGMLRGFLDDLLDQASETEVEVFYLRPEEIVLISTLAKNAQQAAFSPYGLTSFLEH